MKLNETKFGLSVGLAFAIIWVVCSILVLLLPMPIMSMSGDMVHMNTSGLNWTMGFAGFFVGLITWTFSAGVTGWLIAFIYNKLLD